MSPLKALTIAESVLSHSTIRAYTEDTSLSDVPDHVLDDFVSMGETKHLREQLDRIEFNIKREAESGRKTKLKMSPRDEKQYRWVQRRLGEAKLRDRLTEARRGLGEAYRHCWCLGRGGRRPVALSVQIGPPALTETEYVYPPSGTHEMTWSTYCSCPDGQAAERRGNEHRAYVLAEVQRRNVEKITGIANIPLSLQGVTVAKWVKAAREHGADESEVKAISGLLVLWHEEATTKPVAGEPPKPILLILAGAYGSGKTTIAAAIAQSYLSRGQGVIFRHVSDLLDELRESWHARVDGATERELIRAYVTVPLLVVDDLGAQPLIDVKAMAEANLIARIFDTRSTNGLPTIVTTNLASVDLAARMTDRIMERLTPGSYARVIKVNTPNLREVQDDRETY